MKTHTAQGAGSHQPCSSADSTEQSEPQDPSTSPPVSPTSTKSLALQRTRSCRPRGYELLAGMSWGPGAHTGPSNDERKNAVQTNCSVLKLSQDTCDLSVMDMV